MTSRVPGFIVELERWAANNLFHFNTTLPVVDPQLRDLAKEVADHLKTTEEGRPASSSEEEKPSAAASKASPPTKPKATPDREDVT